MPEVHDVHGGLMPPVKHGHHQDVPQLVAGAKVVQLAWEITFWDFGDVEQEGRSSDEVHDQHARKEQLHHGSGESPGEPDPVAGGNHADPSHAAKDGHSYPPPVVAEVTGMDLGTEDRQDQGEHGQQVHLTPKGVTVESVEDSRHVAAQDAHGYACVVQSQPAAAGLLRAVAGEEVVAHRAQHAHLEAEESNGVDNVVLFVCP